MLEPHGQGRNRYSGRLLMRRLIDGLPSCHRADTSMSPLIKKQTATAGFGQPSSAISKNAG